MDYKTSGVDVEAGRAFVGQIKSCVDSTRRKEVIGSMGGFGGFIRLPEGFSKPVLVAGTDGVGTKLELAQKYQSHFGVGIDLVAMCVNDVITSGAEPLFFLDYIATGKLSPESMVEVITGISDGCKKSGCSLLGGETAEMPGFYNKGQYDLAGFCVGVVEEDQLIDGSKIQVDDQIIGVQSSGVHSNGFSLVRKILDMHNKSESPQTSSQTISIAKELLKPTEIYCNLVKGLLEKAIPLHGMAHITGGGLPENLPRCFPESFNPVIDPTTWTRPEVFNWLQREGNVPELDLWNTFNLGIGFCLVLPSNSVQQALEICSVNCMDAWHIGRVQPSNSISRDLIIDSL